MKQFFIPLSLRISLICVVSTARDSVQPRSMEIGTREKVLICFFFGTREGFNLFIFSARVSLSVLIVDPIRHSKQTVI